MAVVGLAVIDESAGLLLEAAAPEASVVMEPVVEALIVEAPDVEEATWVEVERVDESAILVEAWLLQLPPSLSLPRMKAVASTP